MRRNFGVNRRDFFLKVGSLGYLGFNLPQFLALKAAAATVAESKAQSCILLWLAGGPSQVDTWDPKPTSGFRAISTNVAGIQISELLPRTARHMDKLSIIRTMHTEELDHPEATHYAITGHRPNPAMQFPSVGSILSKEMGQRNNMPPHVVAPPMSKQYEDYWKASFIGSEYDPLVAPDPSLKDFELPDLSLPKSITTERIAERRSFMKIVDTAFRQQEDLAEFTNMDTFTEQALKMILSPAVKNAFDLGKESEKTKDAYGRHRFGNERAAGAPAGGSGNAFRDGCRLQDGRVGYAFQQ